MSFKSVWGFDPEEAIAAQRQFRETGTHKCMYKSVEVHAEQTPPDVRSQIDELLRMFRS